MVKYVFALSMLLLSNKVFAADIYQCLEGPPQYHDLVVLNAGEKRILDLQPDCTNYLNAENYMQLILGITTASGGYIKVTGKDMLAKLGLKVELIDAATGINLIDLTKSAGGQVCKYAAGLSYEFLNTQKISNTILRPVRLQISNIGSKSYRVGSTITWVYVPEGAPQWCSTYGGTYL